MTSVSQKIGMDLKKDMDTTFKMIRDEMIEVVSKKIGNELKGDMDMAFKKAKDELTTVASKLSTDESDERRVMKDEEEFKKLAKEVNDMKIEMDSQVRKTVMVVREAVEEALKIEIRKMNLVIHGVPDIDAEHDFYQVAAILGNGLHMDFDRHVSSMTRIWKIEENKPRPLRIVVKSLDGKKEILSRTKDLKNVETFKRVFISLDLTRRQQKVDKELRTDVKKFRDQGESTARIKYGKIVKNVNGRDVVVYQTAQHV